jgi:hypothetical protein
MLPIFRSFMVWTACNTSYDPRNLDLEEAPTFRGPKWTLSSRSTPKGGSKRERSGTSTAMERLTVRTAVGASPCAGRMVSCPTSSRANRYRRRPRLWQSYAPSLSVGHSRARHSSGYCAHRRVWPSLGMHQRMRLKASSMQLPRRWTNSVGTMGPTTRRSCGSRLWRVVRHDPGNTLEAIKRLRGRCNLQDERDGLTGSSARPSLNWMEPRSSVTLHSPTLRRVSETPIACLNARADRSTSTSQRRTLSPCQTCRL